MKKAKAEKMQQKKPKADQMDKMQQKKSRNKKKSRKLRKSRLILGSRTLLYATQMETECFWKKKPRPVSFKSAMPHALTQQMTPVTAMTS